MNVLIEKTTQTVPFLSSLHFQWYISVQITAINVIEAFIISHAISIFIFDTPCFDLRSSYISCSTNGGGGEGGEISTQIYMNASMTFLYCKINKTTRLLKIDLTSHNMTLHNKIILWLHFNLYHFSREIINFIMSWRSIPIPSVLEGKRDEIISVSIVQNFYEWLAVYALPAGNRQCTELNWFNKWFFSEIVLHERRKRLRHPS